MKTLDRFTTNNFMLSVYEEPVARLFVSVIAAVVVGTTFAAVLDINTELPALIWTSAWYIVPLLTYTFFGLPARHGYGRVVSSRTQESMKTYLSLPKDEKAEFPQNTLELLATEDYDVSMDFDAAVRDLKSLRFDGTSVFEAREQMSQVRKNIAITKKTYDELG